MCRISYENCTGGGRLKDFGVMKRAFGSRTRTDTIPSTRNALSGTPPSRCIPCNFRHYPARGPNGKHPDRSTSSALHRSCTLLASRCAQRRQRRTEVERIATIADQTGCRDDKTKIRPLVRNGNLYHVFPRPDDKEWDGIEYFDPDNQRGAIYVFRPRVRQPAHNQAARSDCRGDVLGLVRRWIDSPHGRLVAKSS